MILSSLNDCPKFDAISLMSFAASVLLLYNLISRVYYENRIIMVYTSERLTRLYVFL